MKRVFAFCVMLFFLSGQAIRSQIPETISYQGILTNTDKTFVADGPYKLTFSLYDGETAVVALWTETHNSVPVIRGIFNVILGSLNPLMPAQVAFDQQYWLGVTVGNNPELKPRMKLTSAAYSLNSARAESVAEGSVTSSKIAGGQVVRSINGKTDDVNLSAGANVTISENGNNLTISSTDTTGDDWKLIGNTGTNGAFLGTTDNKPLELRVNNSRAFRLEPYAEGPNVIGGFSGNNVMPGVYGATICGGGKSGAVNNISYNYGTVGGGIDNTSGDLATVSGGTGNTASGNYTFVGGGSSNKATHTLATVSGGNGNKASGYSAAIGGGYGNTASGSFATVPGGINNIATGDYCFAAGCKANATHDGSFIFADAGPNSVFNSIRDNEFAVRCTGGVRFYTGWNPNIGVSLLPGDSTWNSISDRNAKDNFAPVDGRRTLERLASIPIETWNYKTQDPSIRHIGPMAQDFYEAFSLGADDKHISTVDADGVALAAIQGLYAIVQEKDEKIVAQQQQINSMEIRLAVLEELLLKNQE